MPDYLLLVSGSVVLAGFFRFLNQRRHRKRLDQSESETHRKGAPLKQVVASCEARWFLEDLKAAMNGDQGAMVRIGHMLLAGYGIRQDSEEAAKWLRQAWALQNYKDEVGVELIDLDDSTVPRLAMRADTAQRRGSVAQQQPQEQHKTVQEVYALFEQAARESGLIDDGFLREVHLEVMRQQLGDQGQQQVDLQTAVPEAR